MGSAFFDHLSYFRDLLRREARLLLPALAYHVGHILGICAEKQMGRVHAKRVVAVGTVVANKQAVGDRSIMEFVRESMSKRHMFAYLQLPVTMRSTGIPYPASLIGALVNLVPEACHGIRVLSDPDLVAKYKAQGLPPLVASLGVRDFADWSREATATLAKLLFCRPSNMAGVVAIDKPLGLALNPSLPFICFFDYLGFLATSAVAVTVGNFVRGFVGGMIRHVASPFLTFGHATGRFAVVAVALLLGKYTYSIAHLSE